MKTFWKVIVVMLVCLAPGLAFACPDDGRVDKETELRVLHMSYDAPAIDVLVTNDIIATNLVYPESSGYMTVRPGNRLVTVVPTGDPENVVLQGRFKLDNRESHTLVAVDQLSQIDALFTKDDRTIVEDKAKIRFIHASPDAPAVDIRTESAVGMPVFQNVAFKEISPYLEVDGGAYVFAVTPAGTETEVVTFNPVTLENGHIYTAVAFGTLDDTDEVPFMVRVFIDTDDGAAFIDLADTRIMAIHASPDAPPVDLLVNDRIVATDLLYPGNTGYLGVMSGTRNLKVNAAGTETTVIDADLDLEPGSNTSVFAFNTLENIQPLVLVDDLTEPTEGKAHVRVVHLAPDAPPVDITLPDGTVLFDGVAFGESDNNGLFTPIDAGTYDLEVRLAGTDTVVLPLSGITLEDGKIYTVFANGFVQPAEGQPPLGAEIIINNPSAEDMVGDDDAADDDAIDDDAVDEGTDGDDTGGDDTGGDDAADDDQPDRDRDRDRDQTCL